MRLTLGFIHVWRAGRVHVYLYVQFALVRGVEWGRLQRKGEGGCKNKCVPMMYLKELFIERFCGTRKYKRAYLVPGDKT